MYLAVVDLLVLLITVHLRMLREGVLDLAKIVVHLHVVATLHHVSFSNVLNKEVVMSLVLFCLAFVHLVQYAIRLACTWVYFLRIDYDISIYTIVEHVFLPLCLLLLLLPILSGPGGSS